MPEKTLWQRVLDGEFNPETYGVFWPGTELMANRAERLAARRAYRQKEDELRGQFKDALMAQLGVQNAAVWEVIFKYAWGRGHSAGLHEVMAAAEDYHQFLVDCLEADLRANGGLRDE